MIPAPSGRQAHGDVLGVGRMQLPHAADLATLRREIDSWGIRAIPLYDPGGPGLPRTADRVHEPIRPEVVVTDDRPFTQRIVLSELDLVPTREQLSRPRYLAAWTKVFTVALFATLALAEIIRLLTINAESITAGTIGVILVPRPFDGIAVIRNDPGLNDLSIAALAGLLLLIAVVLVERGTKSPWGRVLHGIREDEEATLALGKNTYSFRLQAFVLGCALIGVAGAVFAVFNRYITPSQFDPLATFTVYIMVILGGAANNKGVVFGAFLFYAFDWVSVRLDDQLPPGLSEPFPYIRFMIIGLLLVVLVLYRPEGLFPERKRTYPPVT